MQRIQERLLLVLLAALAIAPGARAAEDQARGKSLVDKNGCAHCHMIEGKGGTVAPPLDGINQHRDKQYILGRLENKGSKANVVPPYPLPEQLMQHVKVPAADAGAIADYLLSLPDREAKMKAHGESIGEPTPPGSHFVALKPNASSRRGALLYTDHGCAACHSIGTLGGHIGPNLSGVGARRSRKFIENRIEKGAILIPGPGETVTRFAMPPSTLNPKQVQDLTNFLLTLPTAESKAKK